MHTASACARAPLTVLIVEKHAEMRRSLRDFISVLLPDARLFEASSGEDAVTLLAEQPAQLVLVDTGMPVMNGIDATRQIRARAPGAYVAVVSTHEDESHRAAAAAAGAATFIAKRELPGDLVRLLDKLAPRVKQAEAN